MPIDRQSRVMFVFQQQRATEKLNKTRFLTARLIISCNRGILDRQSVDAFPASSTVKFASVWRKGEAYVTLTCPRVADHQIILALEDRGLKVTRCAPTRTCRYNHLDSLCECVGSDAGSGSESSMEIPCWAPRIE